MTPTQPLPSQSLDSACVNTLRFLAVDAVEKARSGHPGTPMEAAPLAYVLWTRILRHNPLKPDWVNRDRFILSAGHASMLLYGTLHLCGYDVTLEELKNFRQWSSRTAGHPEHGLLPGVETTTGPLGQGFATGVGMALGQRLLAARFNRPSDVVLDYHIWAFISDGDVMEGLSQEAASLAGHLKLSSLKYVYLDNRITIEGKTDLAFSENVGARFEALGWKVTRLESPEDLKGAEAAYRVLAEEKEKPSLLIVRTHIGFGSPHKADSAEAHGAPLGPEETRLTKEALGWPLTPDFHIPEEALAHWRQAIPRGEELLRAWSKKFADWKERQGELSAQWDKTWAQTLPIDWEKYLPVVPPGEDVATRQTSGKVINALSPNLPALIGGSADLSPSNNTAVKGGGDFSAGDPRGRNLHFGIREHAMAAALNGLALTGPFVPYGGTFLVFSDYLRPALRLSALMKLGVIYVFTHDSLGVGEDGPTHQPIEHLAALRAMPGLVVLRPADAAETVEAWRMALQRRDGPTALVLTRQKVAALPQGPLSTREGVARGGYIVVEPDQAPQGILLATGSEVSLAVAAQKILAEELLFLRVVSLPSWELFEAQPSSYREAVLPPSLPHRVSVEAGVSLGWERYVGPQGAMVSVNRFGASAPGEVVMERFGFTAAHVAQVYRQLSRRVPSHELA